MGCEEAEYKSAINHKSAINFLNFMLNFTKQMLDRELTVYYNKNILSSSFSQAFLPWQLCHFPLECRKYKGGRGRKGPLRKEDYGEIR